MPKSWEWALEAYARSEFQADEIARLAGMSLTSLYMRANRAGVKKGRRHRLLKAGTPDRYDRDAVEAARLKDLSAQDAELLRAGPRFRCGECGALATGPVCPNLHVINEYLVA